MNLLPSFPRAFQGAGRVWVVELPDGSRARICQGIVPWARAGWSDPWEQGW